MLVVAADAVRSLPARRRTHTIDELAQALGVHPRTIKSWREAGLVIGHAYNDKNERLFEPPGPNPPIKKMGSKLSKRLPANSS